MVDINETAMSGPVQPRLEEIVALILGSGRKLNRVNARIIAEHFLRRNFNVSGKVTVYGFGVGIYAEAGEVHAAVFCGINGGGQIYDEFERRAGEAVEQGLPSRTGIDKERDFAYLIYGVGLKPKNG